MHQRKETYVRTTTTTCNCSSDLGVTDPDRSSHSAALVSGTSSTYVGQALRSGLTTLTDHDDDEEDHYHHHHHCHPWLIQPHHRQRSSGVDVDYRQGYDHVATVGRSSCDDLRRRASSNTCSTTTSDEFTTTTAYRCSSVSYYLNSSVLSPDSWPHNGYTAYC